MPSKVRVEAAKVAGAYAAFGALWILFSDRVLLWMVQDAERLTELQTYKGWFYVAATALLLNVLVRRSLLRLRRAETQDQDRRRLEALGRLAGGIAHDFNNVLGMQLATLEMAEADLGPGGPVAARLADLRAAGERGRLLTRRLMDFAANRPPKSELLDLAEVLRGSQALLRGLLKPGQRLELTADPAPVLADRTGLEQVLMNLVKNAADAGAEDGAVELACRPVDGGAELSVSDHGPGIDPERLPLIFEPFYSTKGRRGLGLGLATVKAVVGQMRGRVDVDNRPGSGCTFRVRLPLSSGGAV